MNKARKSKRSSRRGATFAMVAVSMLAFLGSLAVAIDIGWIALAKTQLQVSADAAALACISGAGGNRDAAVAKAREYVNLNQVGGPNEHGTLDDSDVIFGIWDRSTATFTPSSSGFNATRLTVRKHLPLFLGPIFDRPYVDLEASAISLAAPRDIAFVIDLSGSMNNDTEIWATAAINNSFPGYPTIGTEIMSDLFADFGYGSYPGTLNHVAQGLAGAPSNDTSYSWLANTYLYNNNNVPTKYRTSYADSSSTRKTKAYSWIIDYQLQSIMPNAKPIPDSTQNFAYWSDYLDYIIKPYNGLPPNQDSYRISSGSNPYGDAWPSLSSSTYTGYLNKLGYLTYVQFMMDYGRTRQVGTSSYVNLSMSNPLVPLHTDSDPTSPGYGLSFPPREQPTHAVRLALLAAVNQIATTNVGRPESAKDHVCLITFDTVSGTTVRYPLSTSGCDYDALKNAICLIQAAADDTANTASESGLATARTHLSPTSNPSGARVGTTKVVVFLSDGIANNMQSSSTTVSNFVSANPSDEWFTSGSYRSQRNAAIMECWRMYTAGYFVFPVGVGLGADRSLMDRMARISETAKPDPNNPDGPKTSMYSSGNPGDYSDLLTAIFSQIVSAPTVQLGQ